MTKLSKEAIVAAAFALLEEDGLDALTARAVASRLGVRAGALYYHLPDMAALRDEMATSIMREIAALPPAASSWQGFLQATAERMRTVLLGHRDGARLLSGTYLTDAEVVGTMESPLRYLSQAGFELLDALLALQSITAFTIGCVIEEQHRLAAPERYTAALRRQRLDASRFPLTIAVSEPFTQQHAETFTWGVNALVAGIAANDRERRLGTS